MAGVNLGELGVGATEFCELIKGLIGNSGQRTFEVRGEQLKALGGDGCEQSSFVSEVMRRGRMRDPGAAGDCSKAEILGAAVLQSTNGRRNQYLAKVAVEVHADGTARAWAA
jgi:hypothetical protein